MFPARIPGMFQLPLASCPWPNSKLRRRMKSGCSTLQSPPNSAHVFFPIQPNTKISRCSCLDLSRPSGVSSPRHSNHERPKPSPRHSEPAMAGEDAAATVSAGATAVKRHPTEEEEDDDELDNMPISHSRAKKGNEKQKSTVNSNAKASKVKEEESDSDNDFMPTVQKKSGAASNARTSKVKKIKDEDLDDIKDVKKMKKRVNVKGDEKMATGKEDKEKVKKERKVYELPGQKHDPPAERDPLRVFYESLYKKVPTSDMAATWLMEWGLLPLDVAREVFEKKQGQKLKSPVKPTSVKRKPASPTKMTPPSSAKKAAVATNTAGKTSQKKRKAGSDTDEDDDDFMAPVAKTKRQKASS